MLAVEFCGFVLVTCSSFDDFLGDLHDDGGFGKFFGMGMLTTGGTAGIAGTKVFRMPSLLVGTTPLGTPEDIAVSSWLFILSIFRSISEGSFTEFSSVDVSAAFFSGTTSVAVFNGGGGIEFFDMKLLISRSSKVDGACDDSLSLFHSFSKSQAVCALGSLLILSSNGFLLARMNALFGFFFSIRSFRRFLIDSAVGVGFGGNIRTSSCFL